MRKAKANCLIAAVAVACLYGYYRFERPYGYRTCFLPCMVSTLTLYAEENSGKFPDGPDPYLDLQALYPKWIQSRELLAGISGDLKATLAVLENGNRLTSNECSWIYIPGLSTTNAPGDHTDLRATTGRCLQWEAGTGTSRWLCGWKPSTNARIGVPAAS